MRLFLPAILIALSLSACRSSKPSVVAVSDSVEVSERRSAISVDSRLSASLTDVSIRVPLSIESPLACIHDSASPTPQAMDVHIGHVDLSVDMAADIADVSVDSVASKAAARKGGDSPAARDSPKGMPFLKKLFFFFLIIAFIILLLRIFHK